MTQFRKMLQRRGNGRLLLHNGAALRHELIKFWSTCAGACRCSRGGGARVVIRAAHLCHPLQAILKRHITKGALCASIKQLVVGNTVDSVHRRQALRGVEVVDCTRAFRAALAIHGSGPEVVETCLLHINVVRLA